MGTTDLRVIKTQRDIERAFCQLVAQRGFEQVTVMDLCATALVGRSTFYRYYQDKYDLLTKLVDQYAEILATQLQRRLTLVNLDTVLTDLYRELAGHREILLTLLTIHQPAGDLQQRFTTILTTQLETYLTQFKLSVPRSFLAQLYAANVLTALTWSLENGVDPQVTTFMNGLFNAARHATDSQ